MNTKNPPRVERGEDGIIRTIKKEKQDSSQTVKEQIAIVNIKGVLLGTIYQKTPFIEVLELIKRTNHYSSFFLNNNDERVLMYDVWNGDDSVFPITAWMFPDSKDIKNGLYEDLPF